MLQAFRYQRRHAARYREIVRTLVRHGLGGAVGPVSFGDRMRRLVPGLRGTAVPGTESVRESRPVHLRLALEELGPTFVKLGQILSTRADLFPPAYLSELERLQDRVPPEAFASIRATVEQELGQPIAAAFAEFDPEPLAAASIGQVHAATFTDGTRVVVKVQRAGITQVINEDLEILADLARIGAMHSAFFRQADVAALVKEFSWTLRSELDYRREAAHVDRFRQAIGHDSQFRIPRVYTEFSTRRVLTLERLDGVRIDQYEPTGIHDARGETIAARLVATTAFQVLRTGMFHADPHPGNFAVTGDGSLAIYDFGMVGTIDDHLRDRLMLLALAVSERDASRIVDEVALLGALPSGWDRHAMEREVSLLVSQYVGASLRDLPLSMVVTDMMDLVRRYGVRVPSELALLAKTVSMLEALSRRIDPDINVIAVVDPIIRDAMRQFYSPAFWIRRYRLQPLDALMLGATLPSQVQRLLWRLDRNDLTFNAHIADLPALLRSLNAMVNRLVFTVMTAAAWLGTIFLYRSAEPDVTAFPGVIFLAAFFLLGGLVLYGLYAMWRSAR